MNSSRDGEQKPLKNDLFMMKRLIIMRSAAVCDRYKPNGDLVDQIHNNLFDTMLANPDKKTLKKEQMTTHAHPGILAEIDKQRDDIIKKILYDIAHQDLEALKPKNFPKLIQDLSQLQTDKQMTAYLEEFANSGGELDKKAIAAFQIDFLANTLYQQSAAIPDGKITDEKAIEYLINLGYQDLIKVDEHDKQYIMQSDLGRHASQSVRENGISDAGAHAFKVLQIMTYSNNTARVTAALTQRMKNDDAVSENASSPAWKAKDKSSLASLFPVDDETADLKRQAQSIPSDPQAIEQRLRKIERQALLDALHEYEDRSPKAKKRFMDKNADAIMELYTQLDKQGFHQAKAQLESYLQENFIRPVQESIARQANKLINKLQDAILNDNIDDKQLAKLSRTMTKIIENLGENAKTDKLMEAFSALMLKAHEVNENKAAFRQEVMALADEIMKHVEALSSPMSLEPTEVQSPQNSNASSSEVTERPTTPEPTAQQSHDIPQEMENQFASLAGEPLAGIASAPAVRAETTGLHVQGAPTQHIEHDNKDTLQRSVQLKT